MNLDHWKRHRHWFVFFLIIILTYTVLVTGINRYTQTYTHRCEKSSCQIMPEECKSSYFLSHYNITDYKEKPSQKIECILKDGIGRVRNNTGNNRLLTCLKILFYHFISVYFFWFRSWDVKNCNWLKLRDLCFWFHS